ncbi:MAG: hypothetical protein AAF960_00750 [Bacteroidota bacterium]
MNIRNIKLELTVAFTNDSSSINYLGKVKELMQRLRNQVGTFRRQSSLNNTDLDQDHSLESLELEYDNCILNIDLVTNRKTREQYINRFDLAA